MAFTKLLPCNQSTSYCYTVVAKKYSSLKVLNRKAVISFQIAGVYQAKVILSREPTYKKVKLFYSQYQFYA